MTRTLLLFRLYDPSYSRGDNYGNKKTLSVYLSEDNTLGYSFYGDWQGSGMGFAISNLGMSRSLPSTISKFDNVNDLIGELQLCLSSGYGSNRIYDIEVLNKFPDNEVKWSGPELLGNHDGSFDSFLLNNPKVTQEQREVFMDLLYEWVEMQ